MHVCLISAYQIIAMKTMKLPAQLLLLLLALTSLSACNSQTEADTTTAQAAVRTARITQAIPYQSAGVRNFPALVEASQKTDLAFRVAGQLEKLPIKAGKNIKKGDLLAQIDSTDYQNTLADRRAKLKLAQTQHQQTLTLRKKQYASQAEVDTTEAQLKAAQAALKQAQDNVQYTRLLAPFDGVVAQVMVENYQYVQPQQTLLQLHNPKQLDIRFDVPESLIKSLSRNEAYRELCGQVRIDNNADNSYQACYKKHDGIADKQTRTYPVWFSLESPAQTPVLPGMSVDILIDLHALAPDSPNNGQLIPLEAIFDAQDQQWVWKLDDNMQIHKTAVEVAGIANGMVVISSGLNAGDAIIAAGVGHLHEGQTVRPFQKERGL